MISPYERSRRRVIATDRHCSTVSAGLRGCVREPRYMRDIDEFRLWMQFLRPGANLRLTGISGRGVIGYVEFSDWLSERRSYMRAQMHIPVGIYIQILHTRGNGRFCTAVTRMPDAWIAVLDLRVFTAIESGWMVKINVNSVLTP